MASYEHLLAYASIRCLERDARSLLRSVASEDELSDAIDEQLRATLKRRALDDDVSIESASLYELIHYSDFGDLSTLLRKAHQGQRLPQQYKALCESLEALQRVRKRTMHSRNLWPGDSALVSAHVKGLLGIAELQLPETREMRDKVVSDPAYPLSIELPHEPNSVWNNLPPPDSSDTGLIGREADLAKLSKLLRSQRSVISLIGEGGVGKSALALEAVYELLEAEDAPFEAIVWSSMKTQSFGPAGIRQISSDINSAASLYLALQDTLGLSKASTLDELIEFLTSFRTLLILDNLEAINSAEIRELLKSVPPTSKILITSRVGVGEFEERYPVMPLSSASAVKLIRLMAQLLNVVSLETKSTPELVELAAALYSNPLAIRWFVGGVANGSPATVVLQSRDDLLKYCFANIIGGLQPETIQLIKTFQLARRPLTYAEMSFFNPDIDIISTLNELLQTSILRSGTSRTTTKPIYLLGEFAADYLRVASPPSTPEFQNFVARDAMLKTADSRSANSQAAKYKPHSIVIDDSDRDAAIAAIYLRQGVVKARERNREEAFAAIDRAKKCAPDLAEVYKVAAWVYQQFGEYFLADESFKIALERGEHLVHIQAVYSNFCINILNSRYDEALLAAKRSVELDKCSATLFYAARAAVACHDLKLALDMADQILANEDRRAEPSGGLHTGSPIVQNCVRGH